MGVFTYEFDLETKVAPDRLFKALVLESSKVLPKVNTKVFKKIETVSGSGGVGTIKKVLLPGQGHQVYRIDELDTQKLEFGHTIIEGDVLGDSIEKIYYHLKIVRGPNGGSVIKSTAKFFTKGGFEFNEDYAAGNRDKYAGHYRAVEEYLLENPQSHN